MRLILTRSGTEKDATLGQLEIPGPVYKIFATLEPHPVELPPGIYPLKFEYSNRFKRYLWELKDVPGHSEIKIHNGNTRKDSKNCILIGIRHGYLQADPAVLRSRLALEQFHRVMQRYEGEKVNLEVVSGD